ncbi:MAG TPA: hypothetical protein VML96_00475 [Egibacteraceae bacterium]|nr:hypothetical protein [Egibacteraceae bacterium]
MARADLHYALALDREIFEASRVDPALLDPIVRVAGAVPGPARPITVLRDFQGPQGAYLEHFTLTDSAGAERARSRVTRIELRGEMFEDRFITVLRDVELADGGEHRLTFFINDEEVGSIPVFVEVGEGGDPRIAAQETFAKALQKGAVLWVAVPQPDGRTHTQPVWFVAEAAKVYVFTGETEQQVPGLAQAAQVELIARSKDLRSKVSRVSATARQVPADDELFTKIARIGLGRRLNLPDGDGALERWRTNCALIELTPRFGSDEAAEEPAA